MNLDSQEIPHLIVGACMEVHRQLGRGLSAGVYRDCLALELRMKEIVFERAAELRFFYKGQRVETPLRVDFVIEKSVLLQVECVDVLAPEHKTLLRNHLRLTGHEVGLLVNFNVENMRDGIKRIIVSDHPPALHYREEPAHPAAAKRIPGQVA